MPSAPLGVGLIGCGRMGMDLARKCARDARVRMVAVADPDEAARSTAASELGGTECVDAASLCALDGVDAVIVAPQPGQHLQCVLVAAGAGKQVYSEKPLAVSVAECDSMIEACRSAGVRLFVGQVLRLFPLFRRSLELLASGVIGTPRSVSITRAGQADGYAAGWRLSRAESGGLLMEINAHELDYMRAVLGRPESAYAATGRLQGRLEYEDQAFVLLKFAEGGMGMLHSSMSSPIGEYHVHIQGTSGNMIHGGFGGTIRYQAAGGQLVEIPATDLDYPDPYEAELRSWVDSVVDGATPLFTGEDGRLAVAMAEAAYESASTGKPVTIS